MSDKAKEEKLSTHVATKPAKIIAVEPPWKEARVHWRELSRAVQQATNDARMQWLRLHLAAGNDRKVRRWMAEYVTQAEGRGKKPPCPVQPWPKQIVTKVSAYILKHHPLNGRVRALLLNVLVKKWPKLAASKSNFKRWQRILGGFGEFPSSANPLPIPFDCKNGGPVPRTGKDAPWQFWFRLDRIPRRGKLPTSTRYVVTLKTGGRHNNVRTVLERIEAGLYDFCGSTLLEKDDQWYIHLCYRMPKPDPADVDPERVFYVSPAVRRPVDMWMQPPILGGKAEGLRRHGGDVREVLRKLLMQRRNRQSLYKVQGSSRKGHGRKKATCDWEGKLSKRRKDFVKTYNYQLAADVVKRCIAERCGAVVYYQPIERRRETRFLQRAGEVRGFGGGWDWYQLGGFIRQACEKVEIQCEVIPKGRPRPRKQGGNSTQDK